VRFFPDFLNQRFFGLMKNWRGVFLPEFFMLILAVYQKLIILAEFAGDDEKIVNGKCIQLWKK